MTLTPISSAHIVAARSLLVWLTGESHHLLSAVERIFETQDVPYFSCSHPDDLFEHLGPDTAMLVTDSLSLSQTPQGELVQTLLQHKPMGNLPLIIINSDQPGADASRSESFEPDGPLAAVTSIIHLPLSALQTTLPGLVNMLLNRQSRPAGPIPGIKSQKPSLSRVFYSDLFHSLMEVLPLGIVVAHDNKCEQCTMNPVAAQLIGVPVGMNPSPLDPEIEKINLKVLHHGKELLPRERPLYKAASEGRRGLGEEYTIIRGDGTRVDLMSYTVPLHDSEGRTNGALAVMVDLTDRKRMESALAQNESRLKLALKCAKAGSWEWNLITGEIHWSNELRLLHGVSANQPITLDTWIGLVAEANAQHLAQSLQARREFQLEYRLRNSPRGVQWILASGQIIHDEQGKPRRMLGICMDISDHKLAEESLRENAARFRTMVDASPLGVFITDHLGKYQYANDQLKHITHQNDSHLRTHGLSRLLHPDDKLRYEAAWNTAMAQRQRFEEICRLTHTQGQVAWVHVRAAPVLNDGKLVGYIGKVEDITRQRRAQAELRQSQQDLRLANASLAQRSEDMEELLSITAHDLKHPIVGIQGLLTLLKEDCYDNLDPDSRQNLDLSLGECDRMKEMLTRLSELGRIEQMRPRTMPTQLQEVVDTCLKRYQALCQQQSIRINAKVTPAAILMPKAIIEECLSNLIDNAIKYGCNKPESVIDVNAWTENEWCHFRVRDYGAGIAPIHHERVFKPFRRLVNKEKTDGSGIGLTAVKRLIQRIGGSVSLESNVNQGASFLIRFPFSQGEKTSL